MLFLDLVKELIAYHKTMLIYFNENIVDEFYHEDLILSVESKFEQDLFDDDGNLHIDLPEDFQLFQKLKQSTGYLFNEDNDG